jgi:hypothetical protein
MESRLRQKASSGVQARENSNENWEEKQAEDSEE